MLLLINTGSSSVKLALWGSQGALLSQAVTRDDEVDLAELITQLGRPEAVAHRVVHAGDMQQHAVITPAVETAIRDASPLAPLHNPVMLHYLASARAAFGPAMPQLAVVDTAFFANLPQHATVYALPPEVGSVRRYGFHGVAHAFLTRRCLDLDRRQPRRLVTVQLGAGCSAAAVLDGRAVDMTMGFSPSEGLVMASRAGDVDPGLLVYLMRARGYGADELDRLINQRSGLLGVCGHRAMPDVLRLAAAGDARAALALEMYCYRVCKAIGSFAAVLGGLDAVVFGGGVGENSAEVRRRVIEPLAWLGLDLDATSNDSNRVDHPITTPTSKVPVWVIHVDEAAEMARTSHALLRDVQESPRSQGQRQTPA